MNYICNIRLVNSHTESIGCDHNIFSVKNEILLIFPAFVLIKSCVISCSQKAVIAEQFADRFNIFSGCTIDNSRPVATLPNEVNKLFVL